MPILTLSRGFYIHGFVKRPIDKTASFLEVFAKMNS